MPKYPPSLRAILACKVLPSDGLRGMPDLKTLGVPGAAVCDYLIPVGVLARFGIEWFRFDGRV